MLANSCRRETGNILKTRCRILLGMVGVSLILAYSSGCSICPNPYDCDYPTFGSRTPRTDMRNGRVGSIFSDPALVGTHYPSSSVGREEIIEDSGYIDENGTEMIEYEDGSEISGVEIGDPR